jgi:hypothetical protein
MVNLHSFSIQSKKINPLIVKKTISILLSILFFSCCAEKNSDNCHVAVTISNKSNKVIYFYAGSLPETNYNPIRSGEYFKIMPGTSKKDGFGRDRGCYEELFAENNNKWYYSVFDEQVLLNNNWEDIVANDMVLKRYSFTVEEMQAANWTIIYDGN